MDIRQDLTPPGSHRWMTWFVAIQCATAVVGFLAFLMLLALGKL